MKYCVINHLQQLTSIFLYLIKIILNEIKTEKKNKNLYFVTFVTKSAIILIVPL